METCRSKRKKYRRADTYPFLCQMYTLFRTNPEMFILRKLRNCHGEYDPLRDTISLDFRRELLPTIIHESIHALHYGWSETQVIHRERQIVAALSIRQVRNILKRFAQIL